jgi:hypothetical protein
MEKHLISLDIDGSQMVMHEERTEASDANSKILRDCLHHLQDLGHVVIHNTGISFNNVWERMMGGTTSYPEPLLAKANAVLTNVGTEITIPPYTVPESGTLLKAWDESLRKECPPDLIRESVLFVRSLKGVSIKEDPVNAVANFKVTCLLEDNDSHSSTTANIARMLYDEFDGKLQVTFWNRLGFDITPAAASKGSALEFMANHFKVSENNVIVVGDSLNDWSMFNQNKCYRGILPSNVMPELSQKVHELGRPDNFFFAEQGNVGPLGVIHGLVHFGLLDHNNCLLNLSRPNRPTHLAGKPNGNTNTIS